MAGKVISIEIGSSLTKVACLDYKMPATKVYNSFAFETPEGTIDDGYLKETEAFCDTLQGMLASEGVREKKVVFTITSSKIANREIVLPIVSKDKIMSMLKANATDYFPVDIKNYHLAYTILEKNVTKEEKKMKMLVLAVPLDLLETYYELAKVLGMSLVNIDYVGNSVVQITKDVSKAGTAVSIHVSENNTIVSVMENGVLALQRVVAYGADVAIDTIMSMDKYRYDDDYTREKALNMLMNEQKINAVMPNDEDDDYERDADDDEKERNDITKSFRYMLGSITRVIDYYMTKSSGNRIDMIYLSGLGAQLQGLKELISFEIGSTVKTITALPNVSYNASSDLASLTNMLAVIGAAKNPMNLMPEQLGQKRVRKVSLVGPAIAMVAGLAVALALFFIGQIQLSNAQDRKSKAEKELAELEALKSVKENYDKCADTYNKFMSLYATTYNNNEGLRAFMEEMEEKMPISFLAGSLTADNTGLVITVSVEDKTAAAEVVRQFRSFESINVIEISGIGDKSYENLLAPAEEETDEYGRVKETEPETRIDDEGNVFEIVENPVTFTVTCTYNPAVLTEKVVNRIVDSVEETAAAN